MAGDNLQALESRIEVANYLLANRDLQRSLDAGDLERELALVSKFLADTLESQQNQYDERCIETELNLSRALLAKELATLQELHVVVDHLRAKVWTLTNLLNTVRMSRTENCSPSPRHPMDMVVPPYRGWRLADIIETVLSQSPTPLTPKDIALRIYETHTPEEFDRARSSLATELRAGAKGDTPRWKKIGRSAYAALSGVDNQVIS